MTKYIIGIALLLCLTLTFLMPIANATEEDYCTSSGNFVDITDKTTCKTVDGTTTCTTYYVNDTTNCPYGCDNVTRSCSPPPFQANLLMIILVLIIMASLGIIIKGRK